jgi:hypothetical protein
MSEPTSPSDDPHAGGGVPGLLRRWGAMLATAAAAAGVVGYLAASSPGARWAIAVVCALVGTLGALALALLFERSGGGLRGIDDAAAVTGARSVGVLGRQAWRAAPAPAIVTADADSAAADDYRLLAGKLQATGARSFALLRVDAAAPGVGAQLAAAVADRGSRVALIDPERGTATLLAPGTRPAPLPTTDAVEDASRAARVVKEGLGVADVVVVDLASIERPARALTWAGAVDGALLVAQVGRTSRSALAEVTERLRVARVPVLGTILGAPPRGIRARA